MSVDELKHEISELQKQVRDLRQESQSKLDLDEYQRYGRQLILSEVGIEGQLALKAANVLIVGAGGLGCPSSAYLAGAGVGSLTIVDHDTVESSNLHRQICHSTPRVGMSKAESLKQYISELNPHVTVNAVQERFTPANALSIIKEHNITIVLDCTDTPASRYLISDCAVIAGIPLVSASAVKTEGQLALYNFCGGPCYRCLFPQPPPAHTVLSCGDGGILGPVVGIMGVMQSIETIKVLTGHYSSKKGEPFQPFLNLYSAFSTPPWRYIKVRGRKPTCIACGDTPQVTQSRIESGEYSYAEFCGGLSQDEILSAEERISPADFASTVLASNTAHTLLDVRDETQYAICSLKDSINIPLAKLSVSTKEFLSLCQEPVFVVCRYGNDSQIAVRRLKEKFGLRDVKDIIGGVDKWSRDVDPTFPRY